MKRLLALAAALLVAGTALADVPPPPPPKGQKYVSVNSEVKLGKDVTGYVFVLWTSTGPGRGTQKYERVELGDAAKKVATGGRRNLATLYAVPEGEAKALKADADLFDALKDNKVKGAASLKLDGSATVGDAVKGDSVTWTYTVTGVDDKGVKAAVEGEGYKSPAAKPEPREKPSASPVVAGVAACAALAFGGLWVAGRARRKG